MPTYCLELYLPHASASRIEEAAADGQRAAATSAGGGRVRYLHTTYLADDETCLHFFEAASVGHVEDAARRAGLTTERITRCLFAGHLHARRNRPHWAVERERSER